jgi:hypothetical protein
MVDEQKVLRQFNDGLISGLNWSDAWENTTPGGPWVPSIGHSRDPKWIAACEQAAAEQKAWLAGWKEGHAEKIATGRINPLRGTEANVAHHRSQEVVA